ncbi:MAG: alpha/beta hydrolase, partial [Variibacter sp.]|nr:alpha/beta hydrolase [Variibacter sp.]
IWGTSYSGGHAIVVGAIDRRVKCVAVQVPAISGSASSARRTRPDLVKRLLARFDADREARSRGEPPAMVPVVSQNPTELCALGGEEAYEYFQRSLKLAPHRRNEVTLRSLEMAREYEPGSYVARVSPTPLLMVVAKQDPTTPTDLCLDAYERALHPKKLVFTEGGHFAPYVEQFEVSSAAACDWFVEHLKP